MFDCQKPADPGPGTGGCKYNQHLHGIVLALLSFPMEPPRYSAAKANEFKDVGHNCKESRSYSLHPVPAEVEHSDWPHSILSFSTS